MDASAGTGAAIVPPLRPDVEILRSGAEDDGAPVHLLHDPLAGTFDRVPWPEWEVLRRLDRPTGLEDLAGRMAEETTLRPEPRELAWFLADLRRRGLLRSASIRDPGELLAEAEAGDRGVLSWLFHNYLYFRVPLVRPDAFLRRTLRLPRVLGSRPAAAFFLFLVLLAAALLAPRLGMFREALTPFAAWRGGIWIGLVLVGVKICHELSHAYAAAARGVAVRSMGVVFMVMAPLPYSDVTDAWRLGRPGRLAITAAGVKTELLIAAMAAIGWAWGAPGVFRDACLLLCTASAASTVLTNLNPGMRFDGYYLLSDLLGVDNLQQRAFALARTTWRNLFLGMGLPSPEPAMSGTRKAAILAYAAYACAYRLGLYFGIALLVYRSFPKVLGIFLFAVEIAAFIVRPVAGEAIAIVRLRKLLRPNPRLAASLLALLALAFWLAWPLPRRLELAAVAVPAGEITVYAPISGIVKANNLRRGAAIMAGEAIFEMEAPELDFQIRLARLETDRARMALDLSLARERGMVRNRSAEESRQTSYTAALEERRGAGRRIAGEDLAVVDANESLRPGVPAARQAYLGRLVPLRGSSVEFVAYLPESSANDAATGDLGVFVPSCSPEGTIPVRIERILGVNSESLDEPALAQPHGGTLAVLPDPDGTLRPAEAVYRVRALARDGGTADVRFGQTGVLRLTTPPKSLAEGFVLWLYRIVVRESGF